MVFSQKNSKNPLQIKSREANKKLHPIYENVNRRPNQKQVVSLTQSLRMA